MAILKRLTGKGKVFAQYLRKLALSFRAEFGEADGVKLIPWNWMSNSRFDTNYQAYLSCKHHRKTGVAAAKRAARKARRKA